MVRAANLLCCVAIPDPQVGFRYGLPVRTPGECANDSMSSLPVLVVQPQCCSRTAAALQPGLTGPMRGISRRLLFRLIHLKALPDLEHAAPALSQAAEPEEGVCMLTEGLKPRMSRLLDLRSVDPAAKRRWEEEVLEFDRLRSRRLPLKRRSSTCRSRCLGLLPYTSLRAAIEWWLSQSLKSQE